MIGSDYGHADMSAEIDALRILQEHAAEQQLEKETLTKILDDNTKAFYGLG